MDLSPRLSAIVDRALQYRIAEIVAPAGFGKSTVLNDLASRRGFLLAEIRHDEDCTLALMRAPCKAVSADLPDLLHALPEAFQNSEQSAGSDLASWFVQAVAGRGYKIAVDDLHHLADDERAARLLRFVIENTRGDDSKWVLASRTWPRLPTVAWTAKGEKGVSVRETDLLLTPADLQHFAATIDRPLEFEAAKKIATAAKCWPLLSIYGIRLLQQGQDIESVLDSIEGRDVDALSGQLLSRLSAEEYRALLAIVLLEGASPEELEIAQPKGSKHVFRLVQVGLPLIQSNDRAWRLHDALRAQIVAHCAIHMPHEVANVAAEFETHNKPERALKVAVTGGASEIVRNLLEQHGQYFIDADDPRLLRAALSALSAKTIENSPKLMLIRGLEALARGEPAIAVSYLRKSSDLDNTGFGTYAKAHLFHALLDWEGHIDEARVVASGLASLPVPERKEEACEVLGILAQAHSIFGDALGARATIKLALELLPGISNPRIVARTYHRAARVAWGAGQFEEVNTYATRVIELGKSAGFTALSWAFRMRTLALAPFDEAAAIDCARQGLDLANRVLYSTNIYAMNSSLFIFACRAGDLEAARTLRRLILPVPANVRTRIGPVISIFAAQLALLEESYWEAATLLAEIRSFGELAVDGDMIGAREVLFHAQSALLNQLTSNEQSANRAAQNVLSASRKISLDGAAATAIPEIEISQITAAAVLGVNGRMTDAEGVLDKLSKSASEEYRRDLARWTRAALADPDAAPSESAMRFAKGIIELIRRVLATVQQEALSPTERRVLESLALGRSNKEIAAITGRSVKTVDNQVSAILRKLRARSRGEAVARARSAGALRA
ncbi:MAG: LuxR C-terminal-related transcriptional regulator [Vulcanimicrobiaceae bacterium]|jgi:ATP/maltotriose-dependent transcriptional regulator MalT